MINARFLAALLVPALVAPAAAQAVSPYDLFTRLYRDAAAGDLDSVKRWVAQGADVNFQMPQTLGTALMSAAQNDRPAVVRYLLDQGADPTLQDWGGRTALDYAKMTGDKALIAMLQNAAAAPAPRPALPPAPALNLPAGVTSALTGVTLPAGAVLVNDAEATKEFAAAVRDAADALGGACARSEYVVWETVTPALRAQFSSSTAARGYTREVLHEETGAPYVNVFGLTQGAARVAGVWAEVDGTAVLAWCTLKGTAATAPAAQKPPVPAAAKPAAAQPATASGWPAFGTFKPGERVQFWTSTGWRQGVIVEVGPQPTNDAKINLNMEKKYFIAQADQPTWRDYYDWGVVAHVTRAPYWTGFFVGDWKLGQGMAVNTRTDGTYAWTEVAYSSATDTLRIKADGTYEWKDLSGKVTKGRWTAAPDGPGIVVKDARGGIWTLRNQTNVVEEKTARYESARLYPSDRSQMSQAATRPLRR